LRPKQPPRFSRHQPMKTTNVILSVFFILFGSYYAYLTSQLPTRNLPNTLGVDFMPWVLVTCLSSLSLLLLFQTLFKGTSEKCDYKIVPRELLGILLLTGIVYLYIKAMDLLGFLCATPPFVAILMLISGSRKWKELIITALFVTLGIYFFFLKIFKVPLPYGNIF
jgi:Tripartite tricarboxylate transporter TctB family